MELKKPTMLTANQIQERSSRIAAVYRNYSGAIQRAELIREVQKDYRQPIFPCSNSRMGQRCNRFGNNQPV